MEFKRITIIFWSFAGFVIASPIPVSSDKQLFIDYKFIGSSNKITINANAPLKCMVAISTDKQWESSGIYGSSVIQDGNLIRLYYSAVEFDKPHTWGKSRVCYAESTDGLNWNKPSLNQVAYRGSKGNNILDLENLGHIFIDPLASPSKRYKMIAFNGSMSDVNNGGMYLYYSSDALTWHKSSIRAFPFYYDSDDNQIICDQVSGKYLAYFRQWSVRSPGTIEECTIKPLRTVGLIILNQDELEKTWPFKNLQKFYPWGARNLPSPSVEGQTVLACDSNDPADTDICNGVINKYVDAPDIFIALPTVYRHFPQTGSKWINDGLTEIQLATSRNGVNWKRYRKPYISTSSSNETAMKAGTVFMGLGVVKSGNCLLHYYSASPNTYGQPPSKPGMYKLYCAIQRLDGFVSADAPYEGGSFVTPDLIYKGKTLLLNIDTFGTGEAMVEILEPNTHRILVTSKTIKGNFISKQVDWVSTNNIGPWAGKVIELRFTMRNAKLYAFQFAE
jgi:hypothetical protein